MHPYDGVTAALATMHGKEAVIAPALQPLGIRVERAKAIDTDRFGTFSGEVPRAGSMRDAAIAKARAALETTGARLGLASEGSFGPHPAIPFVAAGREMLALIDSTTGVALCDATVSETTNFAHCTARTAEDCRDFLGRIGFPSHAVIVRPNLGSTHVIEKGIVSPDAFDAAVTVMAGRSGDGLARIETDMRAHLNPTRMAEIAKLARRFAARLEQLCPACGTPGFGPTRSETGLPCTDCHSPTALVRVVISGCAACSHEIPGPRSDGRTHASPAECPECNP